MSLRRMILVGLAVCGCGGQPPVVTVSPHDAALRLEGRFEETAAGPIFELPGKEEALASAKEFIQLHKDLFPGWEGTCQLRAIASDGP